MLHPPYPIGFWEHIEVYMLQFTLRYLPSVYSVWRRFRRWVCQGIQQTHARLVQIEPPLTPFIGRIIPVTVETADPKGLIHMEYIRNDTVYRAVINLANLPASLRHLPPEEWIPENHGETKVLSVLQLDYGKEDVLPVLEMYAGPSRDFYRDLPWVHRFPGHWLNKSGTGPLWIDHPSTPIVMVNDLFEEVTLSTDAESLWKLVE